MTRTVTDSLALCIVLLIWPPLSAQESSCDVPLVVSRFVAKTRTVELVNGLTLKDVSVRVGGAPVTVKNASIDSGSKRMALVLDASTKVSNDEWQLETGMARKLIENARAADRFAVSLVGVDIPPGSFVASGDLQAELRDLASSRPKAVDGNEKIYDALLASAKRLVPTDFGDTIFLFGHNDDLGSQTTAEEVEEVILRNRLRFYAMSFTDPLEGKVPPGFDFTKPLPKDAIPGGADNISHATGYFFSYHSVKSLRVPGQLKLLEEYLGDLYAGIAQPYRISISLNPSGKAPLELTIVNGETRSIRHGDVHYPRFIYPCESR